jgi:hypothetical protein
VQVLVIVFADTIDVGLARFRFSALLTLFIGRSKFSAALLVALLPLPAPQPKASLNMEISILHGVFFEEVLRRLPQLLL